MFILDILVGITLIRWGIWEYKDGVKEFGSKSTDSDPFLETNSTLLAFTLIIAGILFILRIFRVEYFI